MSIHQGEKDTVLTEVNNVTTTTPPPPPPPPLAITCKDIQASAQATDREKVVFNGTAQLTHGADKGIILLPQPTSDPRDPLNMAAWHKVAITVTMTLYASAIFAPLAALQVLVVYIEPDYASQGYTALYINHLFSYPMLTLGLGSLISMPLAISIGRRPVLLGSSAMTFVSLVICATNNGYAAHLSGRMLLAFFGAQCQALTFLIIQDIFFLHQRALSFMCYAAGDGLSIPLLAVVASYTSKASPLTWRAAYWMFAGLAGLVLLAAFFLVPETAYPRPVEAYMGTLAADITALDALPNNGLSGTDSDGKSVLGHDNDDNTAVRHRPNRPKRLSHKVLTTLDTIHLDLGRFPPRTWASDLRLVVLEPSWAKAVACTRQVFTAALFPHVMWVAMFGSLFAGIDTVIGTQWATLLAGAPYAWPERTISLLSLGQIVSGLLCVPLTGWLGDWAIEKMARRRSGRHQPEVRLLAAVAPCLVSVLTTALFGQVAQHPYRFHWFAVVFCVAVSPFYQNALAVLGSVYLIDAHPRLAGGILTMLPLARGLVAFGITKGSGSWVPDRGPAVVLGILAACDAFMILLGSLIYWKGRTIRRIFSPWAQ